MTEALAEIRAVAVGDRLFVDAVEVADEKEWARTVGYPVTVSRAAVLEMITRNAEVLVSYQADAFRRGVAYMAPLKLDDFQELGGSDSTVVSRSLKRTTVRFEDEITEASFFVSNEVISGSGLSQLQCVLLAQLARRVAPKDSDQAVVEALGLIGVEISRRGINKYGEEFGRTIEDGLVKGQMAPTAYFRRTLADSVGDVADLDGLRSFAARMREANLTAPRRPARARVLSALRRLLENPAALPSDLHTRLSAEGAVTRYEVAEATLAALPEFIRSALDRRS